jgi:4a-hydroxytetrahydrobiopterin dehydratase
MAPVSFDDLLRRPCASCHAGTPRVEGEAARELLDALGAGWTMTGARLRKRFAFPDFARALAFVDRVGALSEEVDHHPELGLRWGEVDVEIWTHAVGGLTATDFAWAARVEALVRST